MHNGLVLLQVHIHNGLVLLARAAVQSSQGLWRRFRTFVRSHVSRWANEPFCRNQKAITICYIFLLALFMEYGVATIFKACPIGYLDGM